LEVWVRPKLKVNVIIILVLAAVISIAGELKSRDEYMRSLPVYRRYKCLICHKSSAPVSADLNSFGSDFRKNGYSWNSALALKDSDGDGYPNGDEIGDGNGDGVPDVGFEYSNPGDPMNVPNSIDRGTWGILKSLFEE
jgi:hypothetical protein